MHQWIVSAAIGVAILSSGPAAASPVPGVASGIYEGDGPSDHAFEAIDSATASLPDSMRPLARMRLRKSVAVSRIRISTAGNRIGIAYDAKAPITLWIGEEPVKWKLTDVLVFDVSAQRDGEALSIRFRGDDSDRTIIYRTVGRDLEEATTMIVPQISRPVVFKRVFHQAN
ncbi:hypothetical protein [Sphingomonas phyllosphaerae]|uniref:hypothetical protein n=1 Tax=Sphingomonas phyllosphaerae TaxID=257003 RepID=UPI00241376C1|nr:hypothetical protein [Sphingomonas phyllosphaerae]